MRSAGSATRSVVTAAADDRRTGIVCGGGSARVDVGAGLANGAAARGRRAAPLSPRNVRTIAAADADGTCSGRVGAGTGRRSGIVELDARRGSVAGFAGAVRVSTGVVRLCAGFTASPRAAGALSATMRRACCRGFELRRAPAPRPWRARWRTANRIASAANTNATRTDGNMRGSRRPFPIQGQMLPHAACRKGRCAGNDDLTGPSANLAGADARR